MQIGLKIILNYDNKNKCRMMRGEKELLFFR